VCDALLLSLPRACVRVCGCRWMTRLQGRSSILHHIHAMLLQHSYKKRRGGKHSRANGRGRKKKKKKTPPQLHASSISLCVCRVCVCVCVCVRARLAFVAAPGGARAPRAAHACRRRVDTSDTNGARPEGSWAPPPKHAPAAITKQEWCAFWRALGWVGVAVCVRVGVLGLGGVGRVRGGNAKKRQCRICLCAEAGGH
jgi:hypothetical protein